MKKQLCFLFFTFFATVAWSQLVVSSAGPNSNPENLVRNVLAGPGVLIYNITSYGNAEQFGYFTNGQDLGLDSGVVISTGLATAAASSYPLSGTEADFAYNKQTGQGEGDDDLFAIAKETAIKLGNAQPSRMHDAASIAFEFEPESDTVVFNFVFGSEEYPDYVNTAFNDAFGFFVAGPGYSGPYSAPATYANGAANLAKVPGEDLAITVSTINSSRNAGLYVSNQNKSFSTHYNGFTKVLTVKMGVQACQRYFFRFAIADGTQNNFDSGIFIGAGGFSTEKFSIEKTASFQKNQDEFEEGCGTVRLSYTRLGGLHLTDSLLLEIDPSGSATAGDISGLAQYLVFVPGEKRKDLVFQINKDGITEGKEKLVIKGTVLNSCVSPVFADLEINDYIDPTLNNPTDEQLTFNCAGDSFRLGVLAQNGSGFYRYQWFKDGVDISKNQDSIYAYPSNGTNYQIRVFDSCSNTALVKNWDFIFNPATSISVYLPADSTVDCAGVNFRFQPDSVVGGAAPFAYSWTDSLGNELATSENFVHTINNSDKYRLTVIDKCGSTAFDEIRVAIKNGDALDIRQYPTDTTICKGTEVTLSWIPVGGAGDYVAQWEDGLITTNRSRIFQPLSNSSYRVTVVDKCGNSKNLEYRVEVNAPKADFEIFYNDERIRVENYSLGDQLSYLWKIDGDSASNQFVPSIVLDDYFDHQLRLVVEDKNACLDSASQVFGPPLPIYVPTAFTPDGDGINDVWKISAPLLDRYSLEIFDRFGNLIFESTDQYEYWDGVLKNSGVAVRNTYVAKIIAERGTQRYEFLVRVNVTL